jgi:hypothetical protein
LAPGRKFIRQGNFFVLLEKGKKENVTLLLFNDILLIVKKRHKLQQHVSLLTSSVKNADTPIESTAPLLSLSIQFLFFFSIKRDIY